MKKNLKFYKFIGQKIRPIELGLFFKKVFNIKRKVFDLGSLKFYIDPVSNFGIRLIENGYYEKRNSETIEGLLNEGDVFIDLGANEGYFSILASNITGEEGKVIAIEPQQRLWPVISKNIMLNNCFNIQLIPFAIGEKHEEIDIILTPSTNTGSSTLLKNSRNFLWKRQPSKTVRLDFLIEKLKLKSVKLIKIDIEGFEYIALRSCEDLLKKGIIKNLLIEFHPEALRQFNSSMEEIVKDLSEYGYVQSNENKELFSKKTQN